MSPRPRDTPQHPHLPHDEVKSSQNAAEEGGFATPTRPKQTVTVWNSSA